MSVKGREFGNCLDLGKFPQMPSAKCLKPGTALVEDRAKPLPDECSLEEVPPLICDNTLRASLKHTRSHAPLPRASLFNYLTFTSHTLTNASPRNEDTDSCCKNGE